MVEDEDGWAPWLVGMLGDGEGFDEHQEEAFWRTVLATIADAAPDEVLGWAGAGPLEDFIDDDADRLEWVEAQAARSDRFRQALGNVWIRSWASSETVERIEKAAGKTVG